MRVASGRLVVAMEVKMLMVLMVMMVMIMMMVMMVMMVMVLMVVTLPMMMLMLNIRMTSMLIFYHQMYHGIYLNSSLIMSFL